MSTYGFLRWLRSGASAAIATPRLAAGTATRATFTAALTIADDQGRTMTPERQLTLYGPGDVIGIDGRQVLRCAPEPDALDASYEQFAHVEFADPSLPWMFTPFAEEADGSLLPWIALVVVEERPGVSLGYTIGAPLPVLHVDDASRELPDLTESHGWAHVQVAGGVPATADAFDALLDTRPELAISRLVCPRLLEPELRYLACVVPVFKAGVLAGLGRDTDGATGLAYDHRVAAPVDLPVYRHWRFTTAATAGFETLVRRLVPRPPDHLDGVGRRTLDLSAPGFGHPGGGDCQIGGALRIPGRELAPADDSFRLGLEEIVNRTDEVGPPIYGRWLARRDQVPPGGGWLRQLNVEPRHRVAAGLGTQVVQAEQEAMMAAAWEQVGDILRANQLLRQGQLSMGVGARLHARHLMPLNAYALLAVAGPALSRIRVAEAPDARSIQGALALSCLPPIAFHASFRRITRMRGPLARRAAAASDLPRGFDIERLLDLLVSRQLPAEPSRPPRPAAVATGRVHETLTRRLGNPPPGVATEHLHAVINRLALLHGRAVPASCTPPNIDLSARALDRLRPAVSVPPRVTARLQLPGSLGPVGPELDPVLAAPQLDGAMYRSLADLDQDWLLPGLEHVPANTITGLEPDPAFVEAYMVGLNHEFGRELLWRGYPTDQRGTVFSRFWELHVPSDDLAAPPAKPPQILPIHNWRLPAGLGKHAPKDLPSIGLVLLLRGDLIREFPRPAIVLTRAEWSRSAAGDPLRHLDGRPRRHPLPLAPETTAVPLFAGRLEPDVLFLGFSVSADEARGADDTAGDPGWFAMFTEQPTEPRFGIGSTPGSVDQAGRYESWRDLARGDVAASASRYVSLAQTSPTFVKRAPDAAWDGRSDALAAILLERPFRLYVHASDLLPVMP